MVEIEIEGILFGLDGLKSVTSLRDFEKVTESLKLKDVSKAWETITKARKKPKSKK